MKLKHSTFLFLALALFLVLASSASATLTYNVHYKEGTDYLGRIWGGDYEYVTSNFLTASTILYPVDLSYVKFNTPYPLLYVQIMNPMSNLNGPNGPLLMAYFDSNNDGQWDETMGFGFGGNMALDHIGLYNNVSGSYVSITESSPVPIPGAVWLFGSGLAGLVGIGRWRMRK